MFSCFRMHIALISLRNETLFFSLPCIILIATLVSPEEFVSDVCNPVAVASKTSPKHPDPYKEIIV